MTQNKAILVYVNRDTISKINNAVRDKAFKKLPYKSWAFFSHLSIEAERKFSKTVILRVTKTEEEPSYTVKFSDDDQAQYKLIFDNGNEFKNFLDCFAEYRLITESTIEEKRKEDNSMFNFDFGPISNKSVAFSPYGLAVLNPQGKYVAFNSETNEIFDVDCFNFDIKNFVYKMPTAVSSVEAGDIVIHNSNFCFVALAKDNTFSVIDISNGEVKTIIPTRPPFGFNFITKVVSLMDNFNTDANAESPFGNLLPFMLLSNSDNKDNSMLPFLLMASNNKASANPLLMALMSQDKSIDPVTTLLLSQNTDMFKF